MNKIIALSLVLILIVLNIITFFPVKAKARTIIVPDYYSTITAAIGNATDGDTIFVRKGLYEEHLLAINKTITLIGEDRTNTIIKNIDILEQYDISTLWAWPSLVAVEIGAKNVKIFNFTIKHADILISVFADGALIADNIFEPTSLGISVSSNNNTIARNSLSGIASEGFIKCSGSYNIITENSMTGQYHGAINIGGSINIVYNNTLGFLEGGIIDVTGYGNTIAKNNLTIMGSLRIGGTGNIACGHIVGSLSTAGSDNTLIANNVLYGVYMGSTVDDASNITFYHNNFYFLPVNVRPTGEKIFEVWSGVHGPILLDNGEEGNYWSDYKGKDMNGDGIGETPYVIHVNDTRNYEFIAPFDISNITITDYYPLMVPFDIDSVSVELPEFETPSFELPQSEPLPMVLIIAGSFTAAVVICAGMIVYLKKFRH